ncbi:MAG: sugar ABC transporter substrate-binding protein [Firmicutes bacterium]|nr:sugar ABC transporter substrate-binding protein [Bacillota bacterium]
MKRLVVTASLVLLVVLLSCSPLMAADTITFWKFSDTYADETIQEYIDAWNAANDVQVEFVTIPWSDYTTTRLTAAFASGEGPDVFWVSPGDFLRYVNNGILEPLDSYLTQEEIDDLLPAAYDKASVDGRIYGVPVELEPLAIFYDKALFREKGLTEPESWDELVEVAKALTTPDRFGLVIEPHADFYALFSWYPFLWSAGGRVMNDDWTKSEFDSPATIAALQFWADLTNKYEVSPKSQPSASNDISMLGSGFCAMQESGMWAVKVLENDYPDLEWGVFPIPPKEKGQPSISVTGGWMQVVNTKSPLAKEAVAFTRWLFYESDFPEVWTTVKNSKMPALKSVMEANADYFNSGNLKVFTDRIIPSARPEPRFPPLVQRAILDALQGVMFGGVPVDMAAKTAHMQIQQFLDTYDGAR